MAVLKLSNLEQARSYLAKASDDTSQDPEIKRKIASISNDFQNHLMRMLEKTTYNWYTSQEEGQKIFQPFAYPISSITSCKYDDDAEWSGSEETISATDYRILEGNKEIMFDDTYTTKPKGRLITYVGGMATSGIQNVFTYSDTSSAASWSSGSYVMGGTSGAIGKIITAAATTLTVNNITGIFETGDALTQYAAIDQYGNESGSATTGVTGNLTTITTPSLNQLYPDISDAFLMQLRYEIQHKYDIELSGQNQGNISYRTMEGLERETSTAYPPRNYRFLREVRNKLSIYVNRATNRLNFYNEST